MEAAVRQYDFTSPPISFSWGKKIGVFFAIGCAMFVLRWATDYILHWPHESLFISLFMSIGFAALFVLQPFSRWLPQGKSSVIISGDFVEGRTRSRGFTIKKRISREKIKSISENKYGLCVMDRGKFAARMLGFVFIPATIPDYQEIRSELTRWVPLKAPE
jgi:hypothetical protein